MNKAIKRGAILLLILIFTSCSTNCREWIYDRNLLHCGRLFYPTNDCFNGIAIEFVRIKETIWVYLDIYTFQISSHPIQVTLNFADESYQFDCYRLEGYQKVLLTQEGCDTLIRALLQDQTVWIQIDSFRQKIESKDFKFYYNKLMKY